MKLFESANIGKLVLKNRIVMAPMHIGSILETDGRLSERGIEYYAARAKGGTGLLIAGMVRVDRKVEPIPDLQWTDFMADRRMYMWRINELAEAVHDYGAKMALQLTAGWGRNAYLEVIRNVGAVFPSAAPCFRDTSIMAREITTEEVEHLVKAFEISAEMVSRAGIDAIEIHGHDGYLLDAFTDALWNKRTDKYGGDLEDRLRFPLEVIEAVKRGAGKNFPIIYRLSLTHPIDGGRGIEEGLKICRQLEGAGVDALDIDTGCYEVRYWAIPPTTQPPGCMVHLAESVKKVVKVPVIIAGKLGYPELAEKILQEGKADFIALGRPLIADPEWPNKVREGRLEDICPCIGENEGCVGRGQQNKYISCAVNPASGRERELAIRPAEKVKSVLVVGGGPAGMEAARVAALRGHKVTLWEKSGALGGNLIAASVPDFKDDYRKLLNYLSTQVKKLGVNVELRKEATPELIQKMKPDVVFLATGGTPIIPDIPGTQKEKVVAAVDVLLGKKQIGEWAVVVGGGLVGCETALFLAQRGRKITIIEILDSVAPDLFSSNRQHLLKLLTEANVKILTDTRVLEITDEGIVVVDQYDKKSTIEAHTVVFAVGLKPEDKISGDALRDKVPDFHIIGDCTEPRKVMDAIREGFRTARLI